MVVKHMNEALKKLDEIVSIMQTFSKIGINRFTYIIPQDYSQDVRQLLDQRGIEWKLASSDEDSQDIMIFIPERMRTTRKR